MSDNLPSDGLPRFAMQLHADGVIVLRPVAAEKLHQEPAPAGYVKFTSLSVMCWHLLNILNDIGPSYETKVRLVRLILRANEALWRESEGEQTGGGGAVDERKPTIAE